MSLHLLQSEHEGKTCIKRCMASTKNVEALVCVCFCVRGRQKLKDPKYSPMADDAITWGGIGLGSLVYICFFATQQYRLTSNNLLIECTGT